MQDRFKLKFYYYELKKMFDVKAICYVGEPVVTLQYKPILKTKVINGSLIQCTGFWDCKSKLLYENDLIEINKRKDCIYKICWDEDYGQYNAISIHNKNYDFLLAHLFQDFGVNNIKCIGNIYQNPELLKGGEE